MFVGKMQGSKQSGKATTNNNSLINWIHHQFLSILIIELSKHLQTGQLSSEKENHYDNAEENSK